MTISIEDLESITYILDGEPVSLAIPTHHEGKPVVFLSRKDIDSLAAVTKGSGTFCNVSFPAPPEPFNTRPKQEDIRILEAELIKAVATLPEVTCIQWAQYTPYFNDGDPCIFSVHTPDIFTTATPPDQYSDYSYGVSDSNHQFTPTQRAIAKVLEDGRFTDGLYEKFGDHTRVRVHCSQGRITKVETTTFEHD